LCFWESLKNTYSPDSSFPSVKEKRMRRAVSGGLGAVEAGTCEFESVLKNTYSSDSSFSSVKEKRMRRAVLGGGDGGPQR
jgi:hypothetical protein